jgi:hypothetical protein
MYYCLKNQKGLITLLVFLISISCFSQEEMFSKRISLSKNDLEEKRKSKLCIEITSSILSKPAITRDMGNYKLKSRLQPGYDLGLIIKKEMKNDLFISYGVHVTIAKWMYYAKVPSADLPPGYSSADRAPIIWSKSVWGLIRLPVLLEKRIDIKKQSFNSIKSGISIRYSGLEIDELHSVLIDSNNQPAVIFTGDFRGSNDYKPWITFLAGISRIIVFDNKNIFSVGITADISPTYFFKGDYEITIPQQPITSGTYKINGTSLGLSVQYIFTGYNKRTVRSYQKKGF